MNYTLNNESFIVSAKFTAIHKQEYNKMSKYFSKTNFCWRLWRFNPYYRYKYLSIRIKDAHYQTAWRNIGVFIQQYENYFEPWEINLFSNECIFVIPKNLYIEQSIKRLMFCLHNILLSHPCFVSHINWW